MYNVPLQIDTFHNCLSKSSLAPQEYTSLLAAGIIGAENYVDARTLTTMEAQIEALEKYTVIGRVMPEQKNHSKDRHQQGENIFYKE